MPDFVHLHVHSEYSLLDGLPHPKDLAARAVELNQPALALTDHGALFAAIEFYDACKARGIKPIIGIEAYLARQTMRDRDPQEDRNSYHILLLAENNEGYQNLLKLASAAQLEGFYYYPRIDRELLAKHSAGLFCTTGCPSSLVPSLIREGQFEQARRMLAWFREVFGDRFYVELQQHKFGDFVTLNQHLIELAREFDLPLVATNDAHYLRAEDAGTQDILLCIQTNTTVTTSKRMRMEGNDYYLRSSEEMYALWHEIPEALTNTLAIAERCNVDLDFKGYHLPHFPVPEGFTPETYLRHLCEEGFKKRYPDGNPTARARLEYELSVIHSMGFDTYFLIVWDLIRAARERDIWFNVRGSAAGSIAAYCAGITNLDPLKHNLIFERFLNPGRVSMPDIDLDFQDDRRAELIEYTIQKYGKDNVAQIITFGTMAAKASIRDVGRALDYPLNEVDRIAKMLPTGPNVKIDDCLEKIPEFRQAYEESDYIRKLIDNARLLEGVVRNAGTHAAGVVVADRPIVEYAPLHRPTKGDNTGGFPVVQYEMNWLERVGLLKMDYLGLASLTVMRRACELIEQRHGIHYDLSNIPVEDPKAFDLLARGDVTGVFQVEGTGMRKVLQQLRPTKFEHVVATISLYRPGPMEYIGTYINRLHRKERVEYKHPKLKPILEETFGIIVYQEQIIQAAVALAGYKPGEADEIRKAVGKKIKEKIEAHREKFVKGAVANGVERAVAEAVYSDIEYFARYGFNKAHAANYAVLTCQTAFLKAHYPLEYMTALLTTEIGNVEKVGQLVSEVRRMGIEVVPPNINTSDVIFTITPDGRGIYFALSAIKNVGVGAMELIVNERKRGGRFKSLDDFCRRVDLRQVNRRGLESLIRAGALDEFGRRSQLLKIVDRMLTASQVAHQATERGQLLMFDALVADAPVDTFGILPDEPELPQRDKLADEKELTGAYFSDHPLLRLAKHADKRVTHLAQQLDETLARQTITLAGVVTSARVITTKKGDTMAFVSLEDPSGTVELTVFPKVFERTRELWQTDAVVFVKGKVDVREGKLQVVCDSAEAYQFDDAEHAPRAQTTVQYAMPDADEAALAEFGAEMPFEEDVTVPPPPEPPEFHVPHAELRTPNAVFSVQCSVESGQEAESGKQEAIRNTQYTGNGGEAVIQPPHLAESRAPYEPARHLRIFLTRTNDYAEDVRRMRELLAVLSSASGKDRFTFFVPNPQGIVQLDFPNHSTSYTQVQHTLNELMREWGRLEVV